MRILLDTNIIIPLEDSSRALHASFGDFVRLANIHKHTLLVHPSSLDDIERDPDEERQKISLSRFRKYTLLTPPPEPPSEEELTTYDLTQSNDNDRVDNEILFSIYRDAANILITEDRGLHKKAGRLGVSGRVHYLQQAVAFLKRIHASIPVSLPNIEELALYQIDVALPFFDSLREDYPEFDDWYKAKARDGRRAWVHPDCDGEIGAICIFNLETNPILTDDNQALPGEVLKLCTFKVGETVRGRRIGELFLKAAFRYAFDNQVEHIYLHTRPGKQDFLIDFCKDFGFSYFGDYREDAVYVKEHPREPPPEILSPIDYHRKYFPHFIAGPSVGKYIVPIQPRYHKILFPDNQRQQFLFSAPGQVAGNAIRQAYLSHARISGLAPGDILLFYRSRDQKAITTIGIIEQIGDYEEINEIVQLVSKRTVYSHEEIENMATKKTKVILFRLTQHLAEPIKSKWLQANHIINGNIQTIRRITDESFDEIIERGAIRNCFLPD